MTRSPDVSTVQVRHVGDPDHRTDTFHITIPRPIVARLGLRPGDRLRWSVAEGVVVVSPLPRGVADAAGDASREAEPSGA